MSNNIALRYKQVMPTLVEKPSPKSTPITNPFAFKVGDLMVTKEHAP